jgi:hypothetical protein
MNDQTIITSESNAQFLNDSLNEYTKEKSAADLTQCFFSENTNITLNFHFSDYATHVDQYINIPCESSRSLGTKLYKCEPDGKFRFINSTCTDVVSNSLIQAYEKEVYNIFELIYLTYL